MTVVCSVTNLAGTSQSYVTVEVLGKQHYYYYYYYYYHYYFIIIFINLLHSILKSWVIDTLDSLCKVMPAKGLKYIRNITIDLTSKEEFLNEFHL